MLEQQREGDGHRCNEYRESDVFRLTGVSPETIRAWERRYGVVESIRGHGQVRTYTPAHVRRLLMVKLLVDSGHAIRLVSRLCDHQLSDRAALLKHGLCDLVSGEWIVISRAEPEWLRRCITELSNCGTTRFRSLEALDLERDGFLLIDMPSLSENNECEIRCHIPVEAAQRCLIIYQFASRKQLRSLAADGYRLLKGPLEPSALTNHLL